MSNPPEMTRSEGGLVLPVRATVRGRVRWQVLDERDTPITPRSPGGFAVAPIEGVEQPNLITNLGMDRLAALRWDGINPGLPGTWRRRLAVGTGSTAPAFTDTTLDAEAQRDATSGAFPNGSNTYELDSDTNVWRATSLVTRIVTMTASRNLTEFGLAQETTGDIVIRELLRDGGGTPITVTIPEGKKIRVDHSLIVEIGAPVAGFSASMNVEEYDVSDTLVSTTAYSVTHGGFCRDSVNTDKLQRIFHVWSPTEASAVIVDAPNGGRHATARAYSRTPAFGPAAADNSTSSEIEAYVPGSHQRIKRLVFGEAAGNGANFGYRFRANNWDQTGFDGGWEILFTSPASYTKSDTDVLRVGVVSSWARA